MPPTKPDPRFESHTGFIIAVMTTAALSGAVLCAVADRNHSTAGWVAVGALIGSIGLGGIGYSAWIFRYYRCPGCRCRLRPQDGPKSSPLRIRYHYKQCDVIWDSGITWGGE